MLGFWIPTRNLLGNLLPAFFLGDHPVRPSKPHLLRRLIVVHASAITNHHHHHCCCCCCYCCVSQTAVFGAYISYVAYNMHRVMNPMSNVVVEPGAPTLKPLWSEGTKVGEEVEYLALVSCYHLSALPGGWAEGGLCSCRCPHLRAVSGRARGNARSCCVSIV